MNYLCYFISFAFILYFFNRFHPGSLKGSKANLLCFVMLYVLFVINYHPNFNWFFWILMSFICYVILDDIYHREFNILTPIFVSIIVFLSNPSWILFILILLVFSMFYILPYFHLFVKRVLNRKQDSKDSINHTTNNSGILKRIFTHIQETFRNYSGMGEGDPWLICMFLILTPFTLWVPFLVLAWGIGMIFFLFLYLFRKKELTVALAPILFLSYTFLLFSQN